MAKQKIAIVTGAGTGVGKSASVALNEAGWTVVLAGRREALLAEVKSQLSHPGQALVVPTDVANPD